MGNSNGPESKFNTLRRFREKGSHLEAGVRCATNRDPAFLASLTSFLRVLELEAADGVGETAGSSAAASAAGAPLTSSSPRIPATHPCPRAHDR